MNKQIRLDKYLADMSIGTRSEVKAFINAGKIKVNGEITKNYSLKVDLLEDTICYNDIEVRYKKYEYFMLNKPQGVITATTDKNSKTVLDLIEEKSRKDLFPVGRLDKDTEGLLLITNDGDLAHQLLSPKKHVDKVYYVEIDEAIDDTMADNLRNGVEIENGVKTMPANLEILKINGKNAYLLTIHEGKFHQVKRMFEAVGRNVTFLKRLSMGSLKLDESLCCGEYRTLTEEEINNLRK